MNDCRLVNKLFRDCRLATKCVTMTNYYDTNSVAFFSKINHNGCYEKCCVEKNDAFSVVVEEGQIWVEFVFNVLYIQTHTWALDPQMTEPFCIFTAAEKWCNFFEQTFQAVFFDRGLSFACKYLEKIEDWFESRDL